MIQEALKIYSSNFKPKNIVEIGSRDGHDTNTLKNLFSIDPNNCFIFEAHPECYKNIYETYPDFNNFNCAISNETKPIKFNAGIFGVEKNVGVSSILEYSSGDFISNECVIDGWRMDDICKNINLKEIDIAKIDVEGHTLEVLQGFGSMIKNTKSLQLELEHVECWKGQALNDTVESFLKDNGFIQVFFVRHCYEQSDSFWINEQYLNKPIT